MSSSLAQRSTDVLGLQDAVELRKQPLQYSAPVHHNFEGFRKVVSAFHRSGPSLAGAENKPPSNQERAVARKAAGIFDAYFQTCQRWRLEPDEQAILLGRSPGDALAMHLLDGRVRFWSRDTEDRAGYVSAISLGLGSLFNENIESENEWLRQERNRLSRATPLAHMLEGSMANLLDVANLVYEERGL